MQLPKREVPQNKPGSPLLVYGLGNPGPRYAETRHNVGYWVVNHLLEEPPLRFRRRLFSSFMTTVLPGTANRKPIIFVRFQGYMNRSGENLPGLLKRFGAEVGDLAVVVDNMDLEPGLCRLKKGGGNAGHNGLKSIIKNLEDTSFLRLYIGVGRPEASCSVVDHVLGKPQADDFILIDQACRRAGTAVRNLAEGPFEQVMEELNRRAP